MATDVCCTEFDHAPSVSRNLIFALEPSAAVRVGLAGWTQGPLLPVNSTPGGGVQLPFPFPSFFNVANSYHIPAWRGKVHKTPPMGAAPPSLSPAGSDIYVSNTIKFKPQTNQQQRKKAVRSIVMFDNVTVAVILPPVSTPCRCYTAPCYTVAVIGPLNTLLLYI